MLDFIKKKGFEVIILDSFINSNQNVTGRINQISKLRTFDNKIKVLKGDIRNINFIQSIFEKFKNKNKPIYAVIHFAGLKSVKDSVKYPSLYWDVNVRGTLNLLKVMQKNKCFKLIFSSSATIYGIPNELPLKETSTIKPVNPYGETKAEIEAILKKLTAAETNRWHIVSLRYFNPVGAHQSGNLGEDPIGPLIIFSHIFVKLLMVKDQHLIFLVIIGIQLMELVSEIISM